jgi:hypothetical protein
MRALCAAALGILGCCVAFPQSARVLTRGETKQIVLNKPYSPNIRIPPPIWSGRALLGVIVNETREPVLNVIGSDGRPEEVRFSMPDWPRLTVVSLWGGDDGEIVAAGTGATDKNEPGSFIVRIGADRAKRTYIPVENLSINVMTVGPSGVIWAIGSGKDKETDAVRTILARLSPTGKVLTSTMLNLPVWDASPSQMRASADRVAWLTSRNDYFEFATDGTTKTQVRGPQAPAGGHVSNRIMAISAANTVLISATVEGHAGKRPAVNFWMFDRVKQSWSLSESAVDPFPPGTSVYGFDGDALITSGFERQLGNLLVRYTLSETK